MASSGPKGLQYFWLRRLHSLLGVVPIGAFVLEHFFSNSYAFQGPEAFDRMVVDLQGLPLVVGLEIGLIGLPIFFHVALGIVITATGANNFLRYNYYRNWMYFLQRVTGGFALLFIAYHVWTTRIAAAMSNRHFTYRDMQQLLAPEWAQWLYAIGILSVTFHFANGLATSLITWGITVSPAAQRRASAVSWFVFVGMATWGLAIMRVFG
ncbi:MAG: succinate dehydrogenase [Deltaproteobacteria bacterium]|nr:succinate dehydrogenase [Deltaproteobacteria bacterium]